MANILDETGANLLDELSGVIADELGIDVTGVGAGGITRLGLGLYF